MSHGRILRNHHALITYSAKGWDILKQKRSRSQQLLQIFVKEGLNPKIYGSVARGDVHEESDIDIIFTRQIPSFQIELILNKYGYSNYHREIIMATPHDTIKLYYYLSELESITLPLSKFNKKSLEFYDFGGKINLDQLRNDLRVPGINKQLILIKPNVSGHEEYSVIGNEHLAAKDTGISLSTINERKKVLLRREKHGKTGVFLKRSLDKSENPEEILRDIAKKKTFVRKKLSER